MSCAVIKIDKLSKRYRLGTYGRPREHFRELISEAVKYPFRRWSKRGASNETNSIWALRDISFEVNEGEVVGIIGRNGAGKSTLLKILSKITKPTSGRAEIMGRIGSLIEVGTGFHPDLTGRENIYLSGAILGMTRAEIKNKFDEIVAFSEIEKFIDTPVKHYSSGMYVRLAFSVAAHLEPEILLIDEVLAVGDMAFQQKCMGRMGEVKAQGRTILFVSHNMGAVSGLCKKTVLLENGEIAAWGPTHDVVQTYLSRFSQGEKFDLANDTRREGNQKYKAVDLWVENANGEKISFVRTGQEVVFKVKISANCSDKMSGICVVGFKDMEGKKLFECNNIVLGHKMVFDGDAIVTYRIKNFPLLEDRYILSLFLAAGTPGSFEVLDEVREVCELMVLAGDYHGKGVLLERDKAGVFTREHEFEFTKI